MLRNRQFPFWMLTLTVFMALLLPMLMREGLFIDGLLYSSVSRNLAHGNGTFWFPKFDEVGFAGLKTFHEHPPLYFALESVFFMIFGDGFFVEKLFSFLAAVITGLLIILFWRKVNTRQPEIKALGWLPVLLWIIIPIVFYIYQHNLIEGTMSIFVLLSVFFAWKALTDHNVYLNLLLAGVSVFLASFTKGVPGLFPLVTVFIYWLIKKSFSFKKIVVYTLVMFAVPVLAYTAMVTLSEAGRESLSVYVNERLLGRIESAPTVANRFHVMGQWLLKMIPVFVIVIVVLVIDKFKSLKEFKDRHFTGNVIFFMSMGFAGTLPLMLTLVQRSFYFVPALPFFAMGFALMISPILAKWIILMKNNVRNILSALFLAAFFTVFVISILSAGKPGRDKEMLHDIHILGGYVTSQTVIKIPLSMHNRWTLRTYLERYYNITLDSSEKEHQYLLLEQNMEVDTVHWQKIALPLQEFKLYKEKE